MNTDVNANIEDDDEFELEEYEIGRSYLLHILIVIMTILFLVIAFWDQMFITIPSGHKGVLFRRFAGGTVVNRVWDEGLAIISPWDELYIYDVRVISGQDTILALTKDGISAEAEISYRYRPEADSLGLMHKDLGLEYADKIIVPHVTAATRDVISRYEIEALYTTARGEVQDEMLNQVREQVDAYYPLTMVDIVVRNITLDTTVERAIAAKLVKEQEMEAYDYIIQKEEKEEERKMIEARGIRRFRDSSEIDVLKYYGVIATEKLATSPNAKVVIIGTDTKELPVILNGGN